MDDDFFLIDIPAYLPVFEERIQYGYSDEKARRELLLFLCDVSDGYCMYCYNSVKINGNIYADLEHGIEKSIDKDIFEDCIPNISISCSKCNQKYKRMGEKKRISFMKDQNLKLEGCKKGSCKQPCDKMVEIRKKYIYNGKILIPPFGNSIYEQQKLELQYDLLNAKYIPSRKWEYTPDEQNIIENHINKFKLNSSVRRNREVALYCKNVIDQRSLLIGVRYNNYVVELLRKKLSGLNDLEKAIEVCKIVYFLNFIKLAT